MPAFEVADRAAGALGGRLHLLARLGVSAGEGDSSISFWWRRWIEHSRSPSVSTPPCASPSTWISTWRAGDDRLLEVERRRRRTRPRASAAGVAKRASSSSGVVDEPHALAAAAGDGLQQHGIAELVARRPRLVERRRAFGARARAARRRPPSPPWPRPCRPSAPSRRRAARRRRGRCRRTPRRTRGSRPGSRSRDGWPRSPSSSAAAITDGMRR